MAEAHSRGPIDVKTSRLVLAISIAAISMTARLACAAPASITACGNITAPGSYQLANHITAAGNCLVLKTGRITLDFNGFGIDGNGTGAGITDGGANLLRIIIKNGNIGSFQTGIDLLHSKLVTIEDFVVFGNKTGIQTGDFATVKDSFAGSNTNFGFLLGNNCVASGNRATNNGGAGLYVSNNCKVSGNNVSGNQSGYAALEAGQNSVVINNNASNNTKTGIAVQDGSTVIGNVASYNGVDGILASNASTISENTASFNLTDGIQTNPGCLVSRNTVSANSRFGFFAECPGSLVGNSAHNNASGTDYHYVLIGTDCTKTNNF